MDRKKVIKIFGGFLAVMLLFTVLSRAVSGAAMARVETVKIATGAIEHNVQGSGRVEAGREVAVYTESGQRVKEICVKEGDTVEQGDVLFRLDMDKLDEQILAAQQEIQKTKLQNEDVQNAKALEEKNQQTAKQRAQEDYNRAVSQGDSSVAETKRAWEEAEQELQNFRNSSVPEQNSETDGQPQDEGTDKNLQDDNADGQANENGTNGEENESDGQAQGGGDAGVNLQDSGNDAADREAQLAALQQAAEEAKAAYDAAVSSRVENIRTAQRALEDAVMAKTAPDSTVKQNDITRQQQELTLQKLLELREAKGEVRATVGGMVTQIIVTTGDLTSDGAAVRLADTSQGGRITISVDKSDEEYVSKGSPVNLQPYGSKEKISDYTISNVAVNEQDNSLLDVTIDLPKNIIETGTLVDVEIVPKSENYTSVIPLQALHEEQAGYYVFILQEEQGVMGTELVVKRLEVEVVDKNGMSAALREGVLTGDQEIVSSASRMIQEGSRVRKKEK